MSGIISCLITKLPVSENPGRDAHSYISMTKTSLYLNRAARFLRHQFQAQGPMLLHSPFVYDFYRKVLRQPLTSDGEKVEALRRKLKKSGEVINLRDFGAGADNQGGKTAFRSIADIAGKSSRRRSEGELLMRICRHYQPKRCLEFGTNLGISSLYQLYGLDGGRFISMEGDPQLAAISGEHIRQFGLNAEIITGEFSEILDHKLSLPEYRPDYVFLDGNHQYASTLEYVRRLLPNMPENSIMILDDINWSEGMLSAWRKIVEHPEITVSIDLFFMGICFVKRPQAKEHFKFRFW